MSQIIKIEVSTTMKMSFFTIHQSFRTATSNVFFFISTIPVNDQPSWSSHNSSLCVLLSVGLQHVVVFLFLFLYSTFLADVRSDFCFERSWNVCSNYLKSIVSLFRLDGLLSWWTFGTSVLNKNLLLIFIFFSFHCDIFNEIVVSLSFDIWNIMHFICPFLVLFQQFFTNLDKVDNIC